MSRPRNRSIVTVFGLVLVASGAIVLFLVSPDFRDDDSVSLALRLTARLAFFVYLAIFMARPLAELFPTARTRSLRAARPYLGVAFAAIMIVHLALIGWRFGFVIGQVPPAVTLLAGGVTYTLILLMLVTTFEAPARALGPVAWRRLHKTGLYVVGAVFLNALVRDVISHPSDPVYLGIGILIVVALVLRVSAYARRRTQKTAAIDSAR